VTEWLFDEAAHAGAPHTGREAVEAYDAKAAFDPAAELELVSALAPPDGTLVDIGAGTGTFAVAAAARWDRVVAIDPSPAMVAAARAKAAASGRTNIELVEAGFLTYVHTGAAPRVVYSRNALHHLPDLWKVVALERVAQLLPRRGVLRLVDLALAVEPDQVGPTVDAWLAGAPNVADDAWTRDEIATDLRTEHVTFAWLLEAMLHRVGFEIRSAEYSPLRTFARYVCVRRAAG
jgi:FkbM family methyltransferase